MSTPEQMARDPRYPTDFEWAAVIDRGHLDDYEAKTVTNVREIVEWQRARIDELESQSREKDANIAELIETLQRTEAAKEKK